MPVIKYGKDNQTHLINGDSILYPRAKTPERKALCYAYDMWSNGHNVSIDGMEPRLLVKGDVGWTVVRRFSGVGSLFLYLTDINPVIGCSVPFKLNDIEIESVLCGNVFTLNGKEFMVEV